MFAEGSISVFVVDLLFCGAIYTMIRRAKLGLKVPAIHKVAGLEALDEAIGRATEMGRPVHFTTGLSDMSEPQTLAGFSAMGYVAKQCAKYDADIIVTNSVPINQPVTEEIVKEAYVSEGKSGNYKSENVRFISNDQFAYVSGVVGIFNREKPAANVMIGAFWAESLLMAETGAQAGSIQIAGTANTHQIPFFVAACDYCLIGEEIYAAGAYLSKEPVLLGNLIAGDWGKMVAAATIIVGAVLSTMSSTNWLGDILNK